MTPKQWLNSEKTMSELASAAPAGFDAARFKRAVQTQIGRDSKLAQCSFESFAACALECAQLGLYPGPSGHAYLIPRKNKQGGYDCTLMPGYRGKLHALRRALPGAHIDALHVHEAEEHDFDLIVGKMPRHRIALRDRGESIGCYAFAALPGDSFVYHRYMSRSELEEFRRQHAPKGFSPWETHPQEMERKTLLHLLMKVLPTDEVSDRLMALDDGGMVIDVETVPTKTPARNPVAQTLALGDESSAVPAEFIETETAEVAS